MTSTRPILAICRDHALLTAARRVAAAVDRELIERPDTLGRAEWDAAALVLIDVASAESIAEQHFPRRCGTLLLAPEHADVEHWRAATKVGADTVFVLPEHENHLVQALAASVDNDGGDGTVVAVVGGCGGAGASTFAVALALANDDGRTLLIDLDPQGGGLDLLLGWEGRGGLRWPDLVLDGGRVSAAALHGALPAHGSVAALTVSRDPAGLAHPSPAAATAVLDAACAAGDLVVCDLPRSRTQSADLVLERADLAILVVPARVRAAASAALIADRLARVNANVGLLVRGPAPGGLSATDVADIVGLPLLAAMRPHRGLDVAVDRGGLRLAGRSALAVGAREVLDILGRRR